MSLTLLVSSRILLYITFYHLFLDLSEFSLIFEGSYPSSLNFESLMTPIIFSDPEKIERLCDWISIFLTTPYF